LNRWSFESTAAFYLNLNQLLALLTSQNYEILLDRDFANLLGIINIFEADEPDLPIHFFQIMLEIFWKGLMCTNH
jgi:hypothetical protein